MSWAEIKRAINSRVGQEDFAPLDKMIEDGLNDNLYELCNIFADSIGGILVVPRVESIPDNQYDNTNYTGVVFPKEVKHIGAEAFGGCDQIKKIRIPNNVISIGEDAFNGCSSLEYIQIGSGVNAIPKRMCKYCHSLYSVRISNGTKTIGEEAFYDTIIDRIYLPSTIETISQFAFHTSHITSGLTIYYEGTEEQWQNIIIESGNARLESASIHYNSQIN